MSLPVPIRVIGTTGTLVFAAMLKAPFCISTSIEENKVQNSARISKVKERRGGREYRCNVVPIIQKHQK